MMQDFRESRALYIIPKLGIPDLHKDEPKSSLQLPLVTIQHRQPIRESERSRCSRSENEVPL
jgi:hypothetical protein